MDPLTASATDWIKEGGLLAVVVILLAILISGARGLWVFGHHYREVVAQRDRYRDLLESGQTLTRQAVTVLNQVVKP